MARLAVELLSGPATDLSRGAELACRRRLAGLFLHGLATPRDSEDLLPHPAAETLRRASRTEAYDDAVSAGEIGEILDTLARRGLQPLVLKGRLLALQLWPRASHRPAGDLDLLLERESIDGATEALTALGYAANSEPPHPEIAGTTLWCPPGWRTTVDLHWRPFRAVGRGIDPERLLRRAQAGLLERQPIKVLDEADRLLYLLVHAGKHGLRRLTWLLDLHAAALSADRATWREAARRAVASRSTRPFYAAAAVVAALPGVFVERDTLRSVEPAWPVRLAVRRIVNLQRAVSEAPKSRWDGYAFEILLEESVSPRLRRGLTMLRRMLLDNPRAWV